MHSFSQCLSWTNCLFLPYRHCWLFLPSRVPPENETKQSITYSACIWKTSWKLLPVFPDSFCFPESEFMTCKVVKCVKFSYRLRTGFSRQGVVQTKRDQPRTLPRSFWRSSTLSRSPPRPNRPQTRCDWVKTAGETLRRSLRSILPDRRWPSVHNWKTTVKLLM